MPILAGIFLIIAGLDGMSLWAMVGFAGAVFGSFIGGGFISGLLMICGAIGLIFGILALIGGIMACMRKAWALGLIASILGLFLVGWLGFEASLLSFIALILLAISRKEF